MPRAALWIAFSPSHGRAECPARPVKVQVALMLPRQPAWIALSVGSIITTSSGLSGSRASSGVSALSAIGSSSRPKNRQSKRARASASSSITATAPFMSLAPSPCTRSASSRPGRLPWAGTVSRWPARSTGAPGPASTHVSPRSRTGAPPARSTPITWSASGPSPRDSDGMSTSSSVLAARRLPSSPSLIAAVIGLPPYRRPMRYCGIDVSAKPGNQQLCSLHERRGPDGLELVATFYEPGTVEEVARTVHGFGLGQAAVAVDAPSGHRLDLLAAGAPLRAQLGLPDGRYERMRVCDALLFRRGLPLYPVPSAEQPRSAWQQWMEVGFELFAALAGLELFRPPADGLCEGRVEGGALTSGRLCETYPDAIFCTLLGHRPGAKRTPSGL